MVGCLVNDAGTGEGVGEGVGKGVGKGVGVGVGLSCSLDLKVGLAVGIFNSYSHPTGEFSHVGVVSSGLQHIHAGSLLSKSQIPRPAQFLGQIRLTNYTQK